MPNYEVIKLITHISIHNRYTESFNPVFDKNFMLILGRFEHYSNAC